ncbi:unnamed protein product [Darwinula stevensoni]|uniref:Uncharacterized protein n=1 Tax=Darwinula stevensoni TaxID=69355 RepID=A0A7R9AFL7_9CRUS|nr:unnamed protein product [Darwinula stevensoni]CAG0903101.1 unnamed protein product [Darwinula stevensoni]
MAEQRNREIEKQLKPQVLQQKLSNASTEEKKAKDMLKMEKNAHEETKQELSEIERKLKDSEKQVAELQIQLAILKEELTPVNARNKELASKTLMLREDPKVLPAVQLTQELKSVFNRFEYKGNPRLLVHPVDGETRANLRLSVRVAFPSLREIDLQISSRNILG